MLKIKKIVFYKHGMGFVQRKGKTIGEEVSLKFPRESMNDILKSIVVNDPNGLASLNYSSDEPISEKLKRALEVNPNEAVSGLIKALCGREVVINASGEFRGKIIGIEKFQKEEDEFCVSILFGSKAIFIPLKEIKSISLPTNEGLKDLEYFLDLYTTSKKENKNVIVRFSKAAEREVALSYIMPMPLWRCSYRLIYSKNKVRIEGWALVDNPFDEDLEEVEFSLIAGQPISFIYDFYTPSSASRPYMSEGARGVAAPIEVQKPQMEKLKSVIAPAPSRGRLVQQSRDASTLELADSDQIAESSFGTAEVVAAATSGSFFRYDVLGKINIKRGESALLPIISEELDCEQFYLYNNTQGKNPLSTLRMKNKTSLTFEKGPVVVNENGIYAGESIIPFTNQNQDVTIPYAVELGIEITSNSSSKSETTEFSIFGKDIIQKYDVYNEMIYTLKNNTKEKVIVMLEHPKQSGHSLYETKKPDESTESYYRWKIEVNSSEIKTFKVTQMYTSSYSTQLRELNPQVIEGYLKSGKLNAKLNQLLKEIREFSKLIEKTEEEIAELETKKEEISEDQERLRDNLKSLKDKDEEGALRKRYVKQLQVQEDKLSEISEKINSLETNREEVRAKIDAKIASFNK